MPPDVPLKCILPCLRPSAFLFSYSISRIRAASAARPVSKYQVCRPRRRIDIHHQIDISDFLLSPQISFAPGNYKYTWNFQHTRKSFRDEGQTVLDEGRISVTRSRYLQVYSGIFLILLRTFLDRYEPSSVHELNSLATIKLVAPTS